MELVQSRATLLGPFDRGSAGASAEREYERRKRKREARTREVHPRIGGLLLALRDAPVHEIAFREGALQERAVAQVLEWCAARSEVIVLHDRRVPPGRGNIDHLAIARSGVFVIDTKGHNGRVGVDAPLLGTPSLRIDGRNADALVEGLSRQVAAVGDALASAHTGVPVWSVLCFTRAELPLRTRGPGGHLLLSRRGLVRRLKAPGALEMAAIEELARTLLEAFPRA